MESSREILQSLVSLTERRPVTVIDQEANHLNSTLFRGNGKNCVFIARTLTDFTNAITLKERSKWKGRLCIGATGEQLTAINRFASVASSANLTLSSCSSDQAPTYEELPRDFSDLLKARSEATEYENAVAALFEYKTVEVATVTQMETLVGIPGSQELKVRNVADHTEVEEAITVMAQEHGMRVRGG